MWLVAIVIGSVLDAAAHVSIKLTALSDHCAIVVHLVLCTVAVVYIIGFKG